MTQENNTLEDFIKNYETEVKIAEAQNTLKNDTRPDVLNSARKRLNDYAYQHAQKIAGVSVPQEDFVRTQGAVENYLNEYLGHLNVVDGDLFRGPGKLEKMLADVTPEMFDSMIISDGSREKGQILAPRIREKNKEVYDAYIAKISASARAKAYEEGKIGNSKEEKEEYFAIVAGAHARKMSEKHKKIYKDMVLPDGFMEGLQRASINAVKLGLLKENEIKQYAKEESKRISDEANKAYEELSRKKGSIYDTAKSVISDVVNKGSTGEFSSLREYLYGSYKATKK
jgi:hypothetical protein